MCGFTPLRRIPTSAPQTNRGAAGRGRSARVIRCQCQPDGIAAMGELTHLDDEGRARMVDVSQKKETFRTAVARGSVRLAVETTRLLREGAVPKGDALA